MSQENVEIVREAFRCFEADDAEAMRRLLHPDVRTTFVKDWPEPGPVVGRDALIAQFDRVKADWAEHRITDVEAIADEGEWSVVGYRWQVRGAGSGLETQFDQVVAVRVKDSQVTELHYRWGREDALEAAGLRE